MADTIEIEVIDAHDIIIVEVVEGVTFPQVQSDWNEASILAASYIKNKPTVFGASAWGGITGTLSAQTDLQNALNAKEDVANKSTSVVTDQASNTKYPSVKAVYDWVISLGYITASALTGYATQAWVTGQGYITNIITALGYTPANKAGDIFTGAISATNLSGTNTGDNATNSQYSGLAASKQDTLVSGTNIKTINSNSLLGSGDLVITAGDGNDDFMLVASFKSLYNY